jgi:hypothetical protein
MPAKPDPRRLLLRSQKFRKRAIAMANKMEAQAIRLALEQCEWFEAPAAKILDMSRSTLKQLLLTRHRELGEKAAQRREDAGYKAGNPHLDKK